MDTSIVQFEYTPFIWPFVASLIVSTALGVYAVYRRHVPAATTFAWLMLALSFWTFCYLMELSSATLVGKSFWMMAKYPGAASGPVLWFVTAIQLTRNGQWLRNPLFRSSLWGFVLGICMVVLTNSIHAGYWTAIRTAAGEPELITEHGPFFWVYAAGSYLMVLTSVALFFRYYHATPHFYRQQALLMALGGFIPLGGRILEDFLSFDLFPHVDNVILLLLFSGILFAIAIFRYGALSLIHIAHNLVIQNIDAGIIVLDLADRVIELNPYAQTLAGVSATEIIGHTLQQSVPSWPRIDLDTHEAVIDHAHQQAFFQIQRSPIRESNDVLIGHVIVLFDITARKMAEKQLEQLAHTDPLTGITNRRRFFELATTEYMRARRYQHPIAILMLDIDHFKQINDRYGHQTGDEVLQLVASTCQHQLRTSDILARYGGEEFICALIESDLDGAQRTAQRIREAVAAAQAEIQDQIVHVTISIGVAALQNTHEMSLEGLISHADDALYQAKIAGRNRIRSWIRQEEFGR